LTQKRQLIGPTTVPEPESSSPIGTASSSLGDARLLVATVFTMFAVAVANTTSGAVAQPAIGDAFGAGAGDVGWIVFGYSGAFAVMTVVYGSLARRFGLVRCLAFGALLVAIGAAAAVLAVSLPMLIAARIVQGVGAGAIPTLSMALIARRLSGPARARALGVNVAAVGVGFALGPLLGGVLVEAFGWRGAMALGMLVAPTIPIVLRFDRDQGDPAAPVDARGIVLLAGAVSGLVFVVNRGPVLGPGSPSVLAAGATFVMLAVLLVVHGRRRPWSAFPLALVRDRGLQRLMALAFAGQAAFLGALVIVPVAAARAHGIGGLLLGLLLVPMAVLIAVLSPQNGLLEARVGRPATTAIAHLVISVGVGGLALAGAASGPGMLAGWLVVAGVGFAFLNAPLANEVTRLFPDERRSVALGMYNLALFLGTTTGAAISTAVVQAGWEAPIFAARPLPGFSTGLLVLAALPLAALLIVLLGRPPVGRPVAR
jgi:DHA2 family metal-tetracycline-proton antiporter-like MFS transporter/DHA2 family florfenicol/chloramphenicol resistance protein-like MFS transporter